jgi:iron only hydrogenase large subunit-like protein
MAMNAVSLKNQKTPVVFTAKARCRDCYRCVRVCPAGAIRMHDGQAQVLPERCIACGTCIINCPQHAKEYRPELTKVLDMLASDEPVALSLAPSFVSYYHEWQHRRLPSALRLAGFRLVGETAVGAWHTAQASREHIEANQQQSHICTACPAVVNYVRHCFPELAGLMVPVASPMRMHARLIKEKLPRAKVVFAGPCVAKKDEAAWQAANEEVNAVLTFEELDELLKIKEIDLKLCEESSFDETVSGQARLFPLEGGLLRTAGMDDNLLSGQTLAVSGFREVKQALEALSQTGEKMVVEPLWCKNGCVAGPSFSNGSNFVNGRRRVLDFSRKNSGSKSEVLSRFTRTKFDPLVRQQKTFHSEEAILEVLRKTGKHTAADELNCTACGYPSCREKAIAVLDGMAEIQMCMPFMRRTAESRFETIVARDPNGIVLLAEDLSIIHMNPAFKKMFSCSDALVGRKISYLIDPDTFEKLAGGTEEVVRSVMHFAPYNLICHVVAYTLPEQRQFAGIFVDITDRQSNREKLDELKSEALIKAQELVDHQIDMAQEMAKFLGEHTAKGELLLKRLIDALGK